MGRQWGGNRALNRKDCHRQDGRRLTGRTAMDR